MDSLQEKTKGKNNFRDLLGMLSRHKNFLQKLHRARDLPEPLFTDYEWKVLKSTLLLLPDMAETLRSVFSEQGKTDFTENFPYRKKSTRKRR